MRRKTGLSHQELTERIGAYRPCSRYEDVRDKLFRIASEVNVPLHVSVGPSPLPTYDPIGNPFIARPQRPNPMVAALIAILTFWAIVATLLAIVFGGAV
ncbi:MAG: hypothetical protein KDJ90_12535 [Nitratireductor sp.]|nr:hypothetical protein [Nitratireductor sp.]